MTPNELVNNITGAIINPLVFLLYILGFAYFLWGLFQFIWYASNDSKREEGKQHMLWGVVGLFIIVSVQAIIALIKTTVG